ncbi:hypothetical protein V6N13_025822 [Hibiscus sabdariffa]
MAQQAGTETHGPGFGSQSSDPVKPSELFFNDLSNAADGSTAVNDDMDGSEVEGSMLRLVSRHDDSSKRFIGVSCCSKVPKSTPTVNSERSGIQPVNPGHLPVISGYSIVQLQLLACYLQSQRKPDALCLPWYSHVP